MSQTQHNPSSNLNSAFFVRSNIDFYVALREEVDSPFCQGDLRDFEDHLRLFRSGLEYGLLEKDDPEARRGKDRIEYRLTDRAHKYIDRYDVDVDTICPCDCRRTGFKNRDDGFHCPNPNCDEGPWTKDELNR